MKELNAYQKSLIIDQITKGQMLLVGTYLGSKPEHVKWEAREAQGMVAGRSAGEMTFAVHTIACGTLNSFSAHSVRIRVPRDVDHTTMNASEWTNGPLEKPLPALPVGCSVMCRMSAFWTDKGAESAEALEVIPLPEAPAK